ncbi:hypothetical protein BJ165DRAFT_1595380 [Panaeolus papilionaceus]|nr:hypothetical protein BJ165DRAFT_1595380 [Panaeolus papilionaceus]
MLKRALKRSSILRCVFVIRLIPVPPVDPTCYVQFPPFVHDYTTQGRTPHIQCPCRQAPQTRILLSLTCGTLKSATSALRIGAIWFIGFSPPLYTLLLGTLTHPHRWCSPNDKSMRPRSTTHLIPAVTLAEAGRQLYTMLYDEFNPFRLQTRMWNARGDQILRRQAQLPSFVSSSHHLAHFVCLNSISISLLFATKFCTAMATTSKMEYNEIKVTGPVSVERVDRVQHPCRKVLIMGPTGAGKSSFIEALGLKGSSKISSNGLDGCTQGVSTYKLNNVTRPNGNPIYLVDSPGFADTKISEMAIVSMLHKWLEDNRIFNRLLYLTPITSTRLPGTQRQVLKTFHALTGVKTAQNVTIVTTMWDNIWGENATKRAEDNYQQLQNDIWKDFIEEGAQMSQFYNTQESALSILDQAFQKLIGVNFSIEDHQRNLKGTPFEGNLITDLQDRIQNLESHIPTLHDELAHAEAQGDGLLLLTLHPRIKEAKEDLSRFQKELDDFNSAPLLPESSEDEDEEISDDEDEGISDDEDEEISEDEAGSHDNAEAESELEAAEEGDREPEQSNGEQSEVVGSWSATAFHVQPIPVVPTSLVGSITPLPDTPLTPEDGASPIPPPDEQPVTLADNPSCPPIPTNSPSGLQEVQPVLPQQLFPTAHAPSRFMQVMKKLKCWGDAAAENHEN